MSGRLEDRIRELCSTAVSAPNSPESFTAIQELREALHEHAERLRTQPLFPIPPSRRSEPSD